ncbi:MAG TPA: HAD-IA family hydrolase [Hyphomicrobiales bacterium]|nr:HAD-IA family hydrolase [Rhodobiaceae bacterium]HXK54290.1 HAD-IA family hydrolase [Hyphomicrobiales bacterium]
MTGSGNTPDVIIWDMGGILYRFFTEVVVERARHENWPLERLALGPTGLAPDPDYAALDRGDISEPEYVRRLVAGLARHGIEYEPYADVGLGGRERAETWPLVVSLGRMGRRQVLLTNDATAWLGEAWWEGWKYRDHFEAIVDVKTIGIRKPAPEPYLACTRALGVTPDQCIFIDDMHVNCLGAEAVGMESYWFDVADLPAAVAGLNQRLGL